MDDISQEATGRNWRLRLPAQPDADALFAERLRTLRGAAKMTQAQLAEQMTRVGFRMRQTTIAEIEGKARRPVTIGEALQFATILGQPLSAFTERDPATDLVLTGEAVTELRRRRLAVSALERELMRDVDRLKARKEELDDAVAARQQQAEVVQAMVIREENR